MNLHHENLEKKWHSFLHYCHLFAAKLSRTVNSISGKKKRCFGFTFHFSLLFLRISPHIHNCHLHFSPRHLKNIREYLSIPSFTHEVVYGNQPHCFLELGYDSLFWNLTRSSENTNKLWFRVSKKNRLIVRPFSLLLMTVVDQTLSPLCLSQPYVSWILFGFWLLGS